NIFVYLKRIFMKNMYNQKVGTFVFFCLFSFFSFNLFAQVGIGTTNPDAGSMLDISSSDKGVLLPRVDIGNLGSIAPLTGSTEGLLVYNTNPSTGPGFFYWNGTIWVAVGDGGSDAELVFEDTTFLDTALFINSTNGNPVGANLYNTTIVLTKPTL